MDESDMDRRSVILTNDGSHTLISEKWGAGFHSKYGALQECKHVFLNAGLLPLLHYDALTVFEMGYGSGLNAYLTCIEAAQKKVPIRYVSLEGYPLTQAEISHLNYPELLVSSGQEDWWENLQNAAWHEKTNVHEYFTIEKIAALLEDYAPPQAAFHLVYYDAFGPFSQPEMWSDTMLSKMYNCLLPGGKLVTYCAKSMVRRTLQGLGFSVEKLKGPPGKREMLRATKG